MASSLISNSLHISFDLVLGMDDVGLVAVYEYFVATGLKGFLGCPAVYYEDALTDLFENGLVRNGMIVSTIQGILVEISEEFFAAEFELPMEGLTDLSEVPKDLVFDARRIFSESKEQVSTSCKNREMKIEFRLLGDILAKTIYVKDGSFDAVTHKRFLLMTAITCGVKINWSSLVFDILKDMVTPGSRQAKGYAIKICVLLKNVPGLEIGESRAFPSSRILTEKTVQRYVVINEKVGGEEVADAPRVKKKPVKKAASKKRAATDAAAETVVKKKRTTKIAPAEQPPVPKRKTQKRKRRLVLGSDDEIVDSEPVVGGSIVGEAAVKVVDDTAEKEVEPVVESVEEQQTETAVDSVNVETVVESVDEPVSFPAVADVLNEGISTADDVDIIIEKVIAETTQIQTDEGNQDVDTSDVGEKTVDKADEFITEPVEEMETESVEQFADEEMSLEDILMIIPLDCPFPSANVEITPITLGKSISIPGVDEGDWYKASLPKINPEEKGKAPLQYRDPIKGKPPKEIFSLLLADIEGLVQLQEQVIDEVDKFFNSFSFKKLPHLKIEEISAKEALILSWAITDSTSVALQRRKFILMKYRELLIRKFLEAKKINFAPGDGSSTTNLKVLDWLSDIHSFVLDELKEQMMTHGLRWEKPCFSQVFEGRTLPRPVVCTEILPQISYVDTLPTVSEFFSVMRKRWADVCMEVSKFVDSDILLPVGALNFCRALSVVEPVSVFVPRQSPVISWRLSQLYESSMHFDDNDTADTSISLPPAATDVMESLAKLRASVEQDRVHRALRKDMHDQKNLLSLDLKSTHQKLSAQIAAAAFDTIDVRKEVKEINAKVTYLDGQVAEIRSEQLEFRAKTEENYLNLSIQLGLIVDYLRSGDAKKGEVVAAAPNHLLTIKADPAGEMVAVALGKVVAKVEVREEAIGVDLPREDLTAMVVGRSEVHLKIG
ncbi:hypothetical protein F511_04254 [Dorcoceras hygrometricum]|nr:hypothetical protein F511_04254 [Dorcoceras hygrometricum]